MNNSEIAIISIVVVILIVGIILLVVFLAREDNKNDQQESQIKKLEKEVDRLNRNLNNRDFIFIGNYRYPLSYFRGTNRRNLLRRLLRRNRGRSRIIRNRRR